VLWRCWLGGRKGIRSVKTEWWGTGVVICLEQGAELHTAQLMPLTLTASCFSEIQIVFAFLLPAHLGSPGKKAVKRGCKRGSINLTYANSYYYGLFPRTAWLSQYQKGKTSLHLNEARDDGVLGCSGISWTICKQSAPCSIQITTPTPYLSHSFTDMLSCWQIAGNKIGRIQLYLQVYLLGQFFCSFYSVCNPWLLRWVTKYQKVQWFGSIVTLIFDCLCV